MIRSRTGICHLTSYVDYLAQDHELIPPAGSHNILLPEERFLSADDLEAAKRECFHRVDNADPESLISRSGFVKMWVALERLGYPNFSVLRSRILGLEDGFLKILRQFTGVVISSSDGRYLKTRFEGVRIFLGDDTSDQALIEKAETMLTSSANENLKQAIQEGIKNALDQTR